MGLLMFPTPLCFIFWIELDSEFMDIRLAKLYNFFEFEIRLDVIKNMMQGKQYRNFYIILSITICMPYENP